MFIIKDIQKSFDKVMRYSQGLSEVHSDEIFDNWFNNKKHFIEKWGGLTYELDGDFTFDLPRDDKHIIYKDFISDAMVFADNKTAISMFLNSIELDDFYANKVSQKFSYDGITVNAGAKISKSLKLFFDKNVYYLEKFQNKLSRLIQECKITGRMVMSVHPLDFISSSETAHNWHSCHALDGEYRAGNLSYMQDPHTFLIYLKADKDYQLPNFPKDVPWNSKKWRMLVYMSKDEKMFVRGRQYPFSNQFAMDCATEKLIGRFYNLESFSDWVSLKEHIDYVMRDEMGALQFNDCLSSPSYVPLGMYSIDIEEELLSHKREYMEIGHEVCCLECGGMNVSMSDDVRCDDCGDYCYCEHCGDTCSSDSLYELEGEMICPDCWDNHALYCEGCDTTFNEYSTEMFWDEEQSAYYCEECYDELIESRDEQPEPYGEL